MKIVLLAACLLICTDLSAQLQTMINDPKNSWVASFSTDSRLDLLGDDLVKEMFDQTKTDLSYGVDVMKLTECADIKLYEDDHALAFILMNAVKKKQIQIYSDSLCRYLTSLDIIEPPDTIYVPNPETSEMEPKFIRYYFEPTQIVLFRASQIAAYQPKTGKWIIKTLAVAPLIRLNGHNGKFIKFSPVFWIKVTERKVNMEDPNVTWAVRTRSKGIHSSYLTFSEIVEHKKTNDQTPRRHFLDKANTDPRMTLYSVDNWNVQKKLTLTERQSILSVYDTITIPDLTTEEKSVKVVKHATQADDVVQLRLVREWAWDNRKKELSVRLVGIAPMKDVNNDFGNFLYNQPLFYQRFD